MYELIEHKKLDTAAASITFSNIPQIYTDLVVIVSGRGTQTDANGGAVYNVRFNGSSANYSGIRLAGNGSSAFSSANFFLPMGPSDSTANTFGNSQIYMPNYRSAAAKSWSGDSVNENNATNALQYIVAGLWNDTSPITSIQLIPNVGNFVQHSSATLYGINRNQAIGKPKAIGGNITYANGYWVHTFTGSGSFYAQEDMDLEYLVVAGGGGGGYYAAGGGGAGGYRAYVAGELSGRNTATELPISLNAFSSVPVIVGAGGAGGTVSSTGKGNDSSLSSVISIGGGAGESYTYNSGTLINGGSGGGASAALETPGTGTLNQGFNGGTGQDGSGGGGGGASSVGVNAVSVWVAGNGGQGLSSGITGTPITRAGGGGGGTGNGQPRGSGAAGGGNGGGGSIQATSASSLSGSGGGGGGWQTGSNFLGGNGGSGVVIVRYRA